MIATILDEADGDLEDAFDHYEAQRQGLGQELLDEFRRGIERILDYPNAWPPLDLTYRRYRIHRFPYGIVYRVDIALDQILVVAFMQLNQRPGWWRGRDRH